MGEYEEAEAAIENAFLVRRFSPLIRWRAGNFYLRRSNLPKMYECFKQACQYDILKLGIAMDVAWKIDPNHREIIDKLIPDNFESDMGYLNFLVAKNELDLAQPVWKRCLKNPIREDFEFKPSSVFSYIDRLLFFNRIGEALQVWDDTLRKARTGLADFRLKDHPPGSSNTISGNLIWNGSFEHEILRGGFDWRYPDNPEVRFRVDAVNRMDQLKSLQVTFGNANISTGHLYQIVPIMKSGTYQLDFYLQTDSLTTDQLPYLIIAGFPDASGASARSDFFPATTSWRKMSVLFTVKRGCDAIQLSLQRNRSGKFDNQITGTLWLDGFVLSRRIDSDKDENALASANN
jgi:hypothetical protein